MMLSSALVLKLLSTHHHHLPDEMHLIKLPGKNMDTFTSCTSDIGNVPQATRSLAAHHLEGTLHKLKANVRYKGVSL